uniref:Alanine and arginine rich domain containing protein n=2 Tax=Rhinolophus ferrumequinum TaxID=59479 RepID=A0A671EQT3_RHIFE
GGPTQSPSESGFGPQPPGSKSRPPGRGLEDLRRRLVRAFQGAVPRGASRRPPAAAAGEEQSPASVQSIVAGLRAELLEMRFQNRHLAKTLLDLNMKMQQLKKEYALEIASESQRSEDNAVNLE